MGNDPYNKKPVTKSDNLRFPEPPPLLGDNRLSRFSIPIGGGKGEPRFPLNCVKNGEN